MMPESSKGVGGGERKEKDEKPVVHYKDPYCTQQGLSSDGTSAKHEECFPEFSFQLTGGWGDFSTGS